MSALADTEVERLRLLAFELRAKADELLAALPGAATELAPPSEPPYMRMAEYAKSRGFAYRTVLELIGEGMPSVGEGRRRRVIVREADRWLKTKGARPARAKTKESTDADG